MNLFGEFGVGSGPGDSDGGSANSHRQISLPLCMFLDADFPIRARSSGPDGTVSSHRTTDDQTLSIWQLNHLKHPLSKRTKTLYGIEA